MSPAVPSVAGAGVRAVAVLLPVAALAALRAFDPLSLAAADLAWLAPVTHAAAAVVAAGCALVLLASGLRLRTVGPIAWAAAMTALAGGFAASALGQPIQAAGILLAGLLLAAGGLALRIDGAAGRAGLGVAAVLYAAVGAGLMAALLALSRIDMLHTPIALSGAVLAAVAAVLAAGRGPWLGPALVAAAAVVVGTGRVGSLELLIAPVAVAAAGLVAVAWTGAMPPRGRADDFDDRVLRLPELTGHLPDGALLFDGRLRLRDWNDAAAELLRLGPAAAGSRLEDLLGTSLGSLQRREATEDLHTARLAPSGEPLELMLVPLDGGVLVLARDPAGPGNRLQLDRMTRELRATIEELMQARRTIDLQRAELERAANIDPLTGVASRAAIMERLHVEVAQARRYTHPVAVVLVDLDRFASINREHGIEVGDAVLREVALRMRLRVREADALGRSAGDAFLAILPHTDEAGAAEFADALRRRIAQRPVASSAGEIAVTASVGVAVIRPGEDLDVDGLMSRADEALASARAGGGDMIALDRQHGLARLGDRHPATGDEEGSASGS